MSERAEDKPSMLRRLSRKELEILKELHESASDLSFYNAAEGKSYYEEAAARREAATRFNAARKAAHEIGFDLGDGYLC